MVNSDIYIIASKSGISDCFRAKIVTFSNFLKFFAGSSSRVEWTKRLLQFIATAENCLLQFTGRKVFRLCPNFQLIEISS